MGLPAAGASRGAEQTRGSENTPHETPAHVWVWVHVSAQVKLLKQTLLPLLFFFDLDSSEDRSNTCKGQKEWRRVEVASTQAYDKHFEFPQTHGTDMVEGGRVGAGCGQGHFHLEGGDERVMGGAASSLSLPPVLTQTAPQQEVLPRGFIFTRKTQQGVLCRDRGKLSTAHTLGN